MSKEVIITIDEEGNLSIETKGYSGSSCITELAELEESLGKVKIKKKQEFFQSNHAAQKVQNG